MSIANCRVRKTNREGELDQESKPSEAVRKTGMTLKDRDGLFSITKYLDSSYQGTGVADDEAHGVPPTPKVWIGGGYSETNLASDQEHEIEKMIGRGFAANMPMFVKVMDSIVERKLRLMSMSESRDTGTWFGRVPNATLQENRDAVKKMIAESLDKVESVKTVSYRQSSDRLFLVIVYVGQEHEKAFDQIEEELIKLENALPKYEFEPWILHSSEAEERHFHGTETILQRS